VNNYHSLDSLILHRKFCAFVNLSIDEHFHQVQFPKLYFTYSYKRFIFIEDLISYYNYTAILTLSKAAQLINNCGTIGAAQKAGQHAKPLPKPLRQQGQKRKQPELELELEPKLEPELVVLRTSGRKRQRRTGAFVY
jgi:hypothetical protein